VPQSFIFDVRKTTFDGIRQIVTGDVFHGGRLGF
jgi:hypothetical protein